MGSNQDHTTPSAATELRRHAEEQLQVNITGLQPARTDQAMQKIVHELEVHQIELEMQNEELRRAQEELELSRNTYTELYDFAPIAYFIFDTHGLIREANFAGGQLLGADRSVLAHQPFIGFIADAAGKELFSHHLQQVAQQQEMQKCEIRLSGKDGAIIHGHLQSITVRSCTGNVDCILTSIVDGSVHHQLDEVLKNAHDLLESTVYERTAELTTANTQLVQEIEERTRAEESLKQAYTEIKNLKNRLQAENIHLQQEVARKYNFGEIIGQSDAISQVFTKIEQVAPMDATVLLLGETGTGKGVIARAIHSRSSRKDRAMITVNCTALPANLIESELFGRERGAFTGADARQMGRFELADGGTIFLDEIGEMPMELQCKLLRVIQDGEFERLGSPRTIKVNVRIIAASNRNLEDEIRNGTFRKDLFYRLNVFPITIPPLRQRAEDIPLLINHFVTKFNKKIGKKITSVSPDILNTLQRYQWPGNVRELESIIERAVITSQGTALHVLDKLDSIQDTEAPVSQNIKALSELEQQHIIQILQKTGWRIEGANGAAVLLGLNPSTLRARMRKYGIRRQ